MAKKKSTKAENAKPVGKEQLGLQVPPDIDAEFRAMCKEHDCFLGVGFTAAVRVFLAFPSDAQRAFIRRVKEPDKFPDTWDHLAAEARKLTFELLSEPVRESPD